MAKIEIENDTHWRTSDIKHVVQLALAAGGVEENETARVTVEWGSVHCPISVKSCGENPIITIGLPRRGSKNHHSNPMLAVALSALKIDTSAPILSFTSAFHIGNYIAFRCAEEREWPDDTVERLRRAALIGEPMPPAWSPVESFVIQKYKDPLKDGTYLSFVEKKRKELVRAASAVERLEAALRATQARLTRARTKKRVAERSLQAARERRTAS